MLDPVIVNLPDQEGPEASARALDGPSFDAGSSPDDEEPLAGNPPHPATHPHARTIRQTVTESIIPGSRVIRTPSFRTSGLFEDEPTATQLQSRTLSPGFDI